MLNLMWFKSDLRVRDNPALLAAMSRGAVVAVYLLSEKQWHKHGISVARKSLIMRQLVCLNEELASLNVPLVVLQTDSFDSLPGDLLRFASKHSARGIFCNREYELNECRCEQRVRELASEQCLSFEAHHESCLVEPGLIRNQQGQPFKVFSAFKRAFYQNATQLLRPLYSLPKPQRQIACGSDLSALSELQAKGSYHAVQAERWPAGEQQAHQRLEDFGHRGIRDYDRLRDIPSADGTSQISPYLAIGVLSTRQCLQLVIQENNGSFESATEGIQSWVNELLWREFYRHLLNDYPKLCRYQPFKADTDRLPWKQDFNLFDAWKNGRTGYPIVDAAMRQLNKIGWMHNRLRMVTAMFLTKHLFIDWRWGEAYFMSQLVDGDLASNNGGWQWSASTGVDAVPYFRIFNPTRQSQRFDSQGRFIRRFVPELAGLDNKSIHQPTTSQALSSGYCLPIVDHRDATAQTRAHFMQLKHMQNSPAERYSTRSDDDDQTNPGACQKQEFELI